MQFDLLPICGDIPFKYRASLRPSLAHQRGLGDLTDVLQRDQRIGTAASDMDLFFSPHDEIEMVQNFLQLAGHLFRFDKAGLAIA
ncbi:hypothetical protein D3C77_673800 [compost metagenome]